MELYFIRLFHPFSPLDGASDDYADSNEEQDAGTTIINGQGSLQLVRNNVCIIYFYFYYFYDG